tara:strand:- start:290 stop:967 length:678 start_codon:yes stop_codon:yes gene_type:complete
MVDAKKIGLAAAAVVLVSLVTMYGTSYMADFENNPRNVTQNEIKLEDQKHPPVLGSDSATITIVEVGDYQCHMCKMWFEKTRPLIIENYVNTGKVNLIFVDMPFLGNDSLPASEATYCAHDQGKYWEYHSALFEYQQEIDDGWANSNRLQAIALNLDLNIEKFDQCMASDKHLNKINSSNQLARNEFGANSTPTFIIGSTTSGDGQKIIGAHPYSTFEEIINSML